MPRPYRGRRGNQARAVASSLWCVPVDAEDAGWLRLAVVVNIYGGTLMRNNNEHIKQELSNLEQSIGSYAFRRFIFICLDLKVTLSICLLRKILLVKYFTDFSVIGVMVASSSSCVSSYHSAKKRA